MAGRFHARPPNGMPGGNYGNAAGGVGLPASGGHMLFPPPWFSPLGTPLSEAPPFKRKSAGGKTHPGFAAARGDTARLSFVLCVAALHRPRPELPNTASLNTSGLGGRHHTAALPIPPTPQGIQAHRPHCVLSPVCPASCFWGATNRRCAPWKRPALRSLAMKNRMRG